MYLTSEDFQKVTDVSDSFVLHCVANKSLIESHDAICERSLFLEAVDEMKGRHCRWEIGVVTDQV